MGFRVQGGESRVGREEVSLGRGGKGVRPGWGSVELSQGGGRGRGGGGGGEEVVEVVEEEDYDAVPTQFTG